MIAIPTQRYDSLSTTTSPTLTAESRSADQNTTCVRCFLIMGVEEGGQRLVEVRLLVRRTIGGQATRRQRGPRSIVDRCLDFPKNAHRPRPAQLKNC
jgi:hypothetical protein